MKLELGVRLRENQRQWYGKRRISLHRCYILARDADGEKVAEVMVLWYEDTKQSPGSPKVLWMCVSRKSRGALKAFQYSYFLVNACKSKTPCLHSILYKNISCFVLYDSWIISYLEQLKKTRFQSAVYYHMLVNLRFILLLPSKIVLIANNCSHENS